MKMTLEHFNVLQEKINVVLADNPNARKGYESGNFHNSDKVQDLQKRFCWDLFWAAGLGSFQRQELYPYLNDDHIYTALKKICPKVTRRY